MVYRLNHKFSGEVVAFLLNLQIWDQLVGELFPPKDILEDFSSAMLAYLQDPKFSDMDFLTSFPKWTLSEELHKVVSKRGN